MLSLLLTARCRAQQRLPTIVRRCCVAAFSTHPPSAPASTTAATADDDGTIDADVAKQVDKMLASDAIVKLREQIAMNRFSMGGIKAANKTRRVYQTVEVVSTASLAEMHRAQLRKQLSLSDEASLEAAGFNFALVIDGSKVLYTPSGNVFAVPSHALAIAAAAEWDAQSDFVRVATMPLVCVL